jgi:predicted nucleic acid-binding protein
MSAVFADASFYIAIINERDELHVRAREVARALTGAIVTTDFVLTEVANFCTKGSQRPVFLRLVANMRRAAHLEIVPASRELFEQGLDLFSKRSDKEWSLTDCMSMALMAERGLTNVATSDHHFAQAGFTILLG